MEPTAERRRLADASSLASQHQESGLASVLRIVDVAQPDQIILFGSAAREEMGPHSDVDLLVIKRGEFDAGRLVGDIYMHLHGVGQAVDVILVTPEQVERYRNTPYLVIAPALREGKEIYRARALTS